MEFQNINYVELTNAGGDYIPKLFVIFIYSFLCEAFASFGPNTVTKPGQKRLS